VKIIKLILLLDLQLAVVAAMFPRMYVESAASIVNVLSLRAVTSPEVSYIAVLFGVSFICSIARRLVEDGKRVTHRNLRTIAFELLTLAPLVWIVVVSTTTASTVVSIDSVITPISSYLLTLLYLVGAGYAFADLVFWFFSHILEQE
jgi:hypothetical protein